MTDNPIAKMDAPVSKTSIQAGGTISAIIPRNFDEVFRVARCLVFGGMIPNSYSKGTSNQDEVVFRVSGAIMKGAEIGLAPMTSVETIMVINGRYAIWGDAASALVLRSGQVENLRDWQTGKVGDNTYTHFFEVRRRGIETPFVRSFSLEDAKRAGLLGKDTWRSYQARMCFNRARAWALRDSCADILMGIAIAEEVQDIVVEERRAPVDTSDLAPPALPQPEPVAVEEAQPEASTATTVEAIMGSADFTACPGCGGSGQLSDELGERDCQQCGGSGDIPAQAGK